MIDMVKNIGFDPVTFIQKIIITSAPNKIFFIKVDIKAENVFPALS